MKSLSRGHCYDSSIASVKARSSQSAASNVPVSCLFRKVINLRLTSLSSSYRPFHLSFSKVLRMAVHTHDMTSQGNLPSFGGMHGVQNYILIWKYFEYVFSQHYRFTDRSDL
jgi:hypothetical protein